MVLFLIALIVLAVWSDTDINRLQKVDASSDVSRADLADGKRSRSNAAADLSLVAYGLLFSIFEVTFVMCYWYGATGNIWLNGKQYTVNHPLTSAYFGGQLTSAIIQTVFYRSFLHFFVFLKDFILLGGILWARFSATQSQEAVMRIMYKHGPDDQVGQEDAVRLGQMQQQQLAAAGTTPLLKATTPSGIIYS